MSIILSVFREIFRFLLMQSWKFGINNRVGPSILALHVLD